MPNTRNIWRSVGRRLTQREGLPDVPDDLQHQARNTMSVEEKTRFIAEYGADAYLELPLEPIRPGSRNTRQPDPPLGPEPDRDLPPFVTRIPSGLEGHEDEYEVNPIMRVPVMRPTRQPRRQSAAAVPEVKPPTPPGRRALLLDEEDD